MRLLEDILTDEDAGAIDRVLECSDSRFDYLVNIAGLDPVYDFKYTDLRNLNFCGADLRGFDFSYSDLRRCIRNSSTIIDDTTILIGAVLDWIDAEDIPIVEKMMAASSANTSDLRQKLLTELVAEFGKTEHVVEYLVKAAERSQTFDEFSDYTLFLPRRLRPHQAEIIRSSSQKLLKKKIARSRGRTGRQVSAIFSIDLIVEKLRSVPGSLAEEIYGHLVDIVTSKQQAGLRNTAPVEVVDLEKALSRIGK